MKRALHVTNCHYCDRDTWKNGNTMIRWLVHDRTIVDFSIACPKCVERADRIAKVDYPQASLEDHHLDHFSDGYARVAWRIIWEGREASRTAIVLVAKEIFDALHDRRSAKATKATKASSREVAS